MLSTGQAKRSEYKWSCMSLGWSGILKDLSLITAAMHKPSESLRADSTESKIRVRSRGFFVDKYSVDDHVDIVFIVF